MLIVDIAKLYGLGPGVIHYAQALNKAVGNFVEHPGHLNYESMHEARLQLSAALDVEAQNVDISKHTYEGMWKNWLEVDNKFNESFKKESPMTLPKTHNLYAETMMQKALTDRSYFEHSVFGKQIHVLTESVIEREKALIEANEWLICVFGLLQSNVYRYR